MCCCPRPVAEAAVAAYGTTPPASGARAGRRLIAAMLLAAAALDLTRCSLVLITFRHLAAAIGLVAAGIGSAALSVIAARGCRTGQRWAAWAALLIGVASAPQASASGFHNPYTIPDVATVVLGILLAVAVLATAGGTGRLVNPAVIPLRAPARSQGTDRSAWPRGRSDAAPAWSTPGAATGTDRRSCARTLTASCSCSAAAAVSGSGP
jgi:hypothetical protein